MSNTPLIKLENIYFKREDLNKTGSAKDRAIIFQIENLKKQGFKSAVIPVLATPPFLLLIFVILIKSN